MLIPDEIEEEEGRIGEPLKLSEKHKIIALMEASGLQQRVIAARVDMSESHMSVIRQAPAYQLYLSSVSKDIRENATFSLAETIDKEAQATIERILYLRDNALNQAVQLKASQELLDRQSPKVTRSQIEEHTVLTFGDDTLPTILKAIAESSGRALPLDMTKHEEITTFLEETLDEKEQG